MVVVALAALGGVVAAPWLRAVAGGFGEDDIVEWFAEAWSALRTRPVLAWPPWLEVLAAGVLASIAWRLGMSSLLPAYLYLGVAGLVLGVIDARVRRLPHGITLPSYVIGLGLLALGGTAMLGGALLGMVGLGAIYLLLWRIRPEALGFGDVVLAGLLGLFLGRLGLDAVIAGTLAGHLLAAVYAVVLLIRRRAGLKTEFPFGPFMLLGALIGVLTP